MQTNTGKMLEWLKRHAWKACSRLKRLTGSNPVLSAKADTCIRAELVRAKVLIGQSIPSNVLQSRATGIPFIFPLQSFKHGIGRAAPVSQPQSGAVATGIPLSIGVAQPQLALIVLLMPS